jgi:hypothetical protein
LVALAIRAIAKSRYERCVTTGSGSDRVGVYEQKTYRSQLNNTISFYTIRHRYRRAPVELIPGPRPSGK